MSRNTSESIAQVSKKTALIVELAIGSGFLSIGGLFVSWIGLRPGFSRDDARPNTDFCLSFKAWG